MIHKDKLKGKHVTYLDRYSKFRTEKVIKITGKTLTVVNVLGEETEITPDETKILGRQLKNSIEEIKW